MSKAIQKLSGIIGFVLSFIAIGLGIYKPERYILIAVLSVVSFLLLGIFFLSYSREIKEFSKKRATQMGLNSLIMIGSFVFIVIVVNLIISQYYFRYDLSATGSFTLSPQTENVVKRLKKELNIIAFIQLSRKNYKAVSSLLDGYRYLNHKITYSIYDLDAVPAIAQQYDVQKYNTTVITDGSRFVKIDGVDEESITNGIIRITRKKSRKVLVLQGHGEHSFRDSSKGGIKTAVDSLKTMGYDVQELNLATVNEVPADTSLLIIPGPKIEFNHYEKEKLRKYAQKGRILLMIDYEGNKMDDFLTSFGLAYFNGLIVDPKHNLAGADLTVPVVTKYPYTPITKNFNLTTFYPTVMAIVKNSGLEMWFEYTPVVKSSENSWLEMDNMISPVYTDGKDRKGPLNIAMLVSGRNNPVRLVVFADSDFITNEFINLSGNGNLFRNVVSFLVGEEDLVNIEPRKTDFVPLYITEAQSKAVMYIFVVGLPLFVGLFGFVVWLKRRRL